MNIHAVNSYKLKPEILEVAKKAKAEGYSRGKTMEEWEALEQAERKTVKGKITYFWKDYLYYPARRWVRKPEEWKDDLIAFWQRGRRGYATRDCWALDYYLSSWMPEALSTMIRKEKGGGNTYPIGETFEKWQAIVTQIEEGFLANRQADTLLFDEKNPKLYYVLQKQLQAKQRKGLLLFAKYFSDLWD